MSITSIGMSTFGNNNLTSVSIPATVTSIGEGAFEQNSLSSITIPAAVTSIGEYAFGDNNFVSNGCDVVYQGVTIAGDTSRFTNVV